MHAGGVIDVFGLSATYDTLGGGTAFSSVADLLMVEGGDYGEDVRQLGLTAFQANEQIDRRLVPTSLTGLFDEFHSRLDALPTVRFRRAARAIDIEFLSVRVHGERPLPSDGPRRVPASRRPKCSTRSPSFPNGSRARTVSM